MCRQLLLIALLLLELLLAGCRTTVVRLRDGKPIQIPELLEDLRGTRLIFIGEFHDEPQHHQLQLDLIRGLDQTGTKLAIGTEMFIYSSRPVLDAWVNGRLEELDFLAIYEQNWKGMAWEYYADIFRYARDHRIPMVGLNLPRELAAKVAREGCASLSEVDLHKLPQGVRCELPEGFQSFMEPMYSVHRSDGSLRHFSEAQFLWNRTMGQVISDYLQANPDRTMVVLAGGGHVRKRFGIPDHLAPSITYRVLVPEPHEPGPFTETSVAVADYLILP